jgi:hypothetical protein
MALIGEADIRRRFGRRAAGREQTTRGAQPHAHEVRMRRRAERALKQTRQPKAVDAGEFGELV